MPDQIVEITKPGLRLSKSRGFLDIQEKEEQIGHIPIDDILTVLISNPACTISTVLLDHLARNNIPLVICGKNYLPCSLVLPLAKHNRQFQIMQAQTQVSEPQRKRAWQKIVQAKITNQAEVLERTGANPLPLNRLAKKVRSGDPENCEAQAARSYWQALFGKNFRRDKDLSGINTALNYVYAVIRACICRGICGSGLHPSISLHHKNPQNSFNLADDIMEPFRPIGDLLVWAHRKKMGESFLPVHKETLSSIVNLMTPVNAELSPLSLAALRTCRSVASHYLKKEDMLFPALPDPIHYAPIL